MKVACPCCHHLTIGAHCDFEICPVCFWEDDGQGETDAGEVRGGPNGDLSLTQARANYLSYGACEAAVQGEVRKPRADEIPKERP